jgi:hypothetical protein
MSITKSIDLVLKNLTNSPMFNLSVVIPMHHRMLRATAQFGVQAQRLLLANA